MDLEFRTITNGELDAFVRTVETAFSGSVTPEDLERVRKLAELDRYHAAFEDGRIVGGAAAISFRMTVPGGSSIPTAGVTAVGVSPTHRRRGITTELMRVQLEDVRRRGEPLAALFASEGSIYGRFGYGVASLDTSLEIDTDRSAFVRGYRPSGRVVLMDEATARPIEKRIYDALVPTRPGMLSVDDTWFEARLMGFGEDKDTTWFHAAHETDAGEPDAYAIYKVKQEWPDHMPKLELTVRELEALTPQANADIWRYLCDVDLVRVIKADARPADEPLLWRVAEPRRLRAQIIDGLYVRLVDVPRALEARRYSSDGRVLMEVEDPFCPWNEGRYELAVRDGAGTCVPTEKSPGVGCTASDLGAVYLGGSTWRELHRAGRVTELTEGALARADAMFAWDPAPWCSFGF
ncbi:MAG: GNAT family N-acetyltransferase [Actinomycetota bacterium]|nr:GNAT family N-acetyltransferase [Actinomycetota bacterium]